MCVIIHSTHVTMYFTNANFSFSPFGQVHGVVLGADFGVRLWGRFRRQFWQQFSAWISARILAWQTTLRISR